MKQLKIIVAQSNSPQERVAIMRRLLIHYGFAYTATDAGKLINSDVHNIDLNSAYFVVADNFKFHESPITLQRLYQMAAAGVFILLGSRSIPRQYEWICEAHFS